MEFLFFDSAGTRLFTRSDAESATWTVEEMSLNALFPYDPTKGILRGQRIGFFDAQKVYRAFEIRKVKSYEPDHYQEITAEHIAVAELSDEHLYKTEITNWTAAEAVTSILNGTQWSLGTNTASGTQTADISTGSVWQGIRAIEENWNVYITPRLTWNTAGITGRYLDIRPAGGVWRGLRLSLDKNADEVGVTWDDTNVITAIYGYGAMVDDGDDGTEILTFEDEVWEATSSHPAKPSGQKYLEDPDAKAIYGRDGRNRFGFYQNSNIKSASKLLSKAWQVLKTCNHAEVSIDCQVRDLYRLGYADQPLQLHDTAIIEVRPTGEQIQNEIIRMQVDLLDPTATRVTIGAYIPNIVYLKRQSDKKSRGGGGGGGRGGSGGGSGDGQENEWYEFTTEMQANQYQIELNATHWTTTNEILTQAGLSLNADGVLVYATDNANMWQSKLNVEADRISLVVQGSGANASIKAASIVASINDSGSSVTISADKIYLDGSTTIDNLLTGRSAMSALWVNGNANIGSLTILPRGSISMDSDAMSYGQYAVRWKSKTVVTGVSITDTSVSVTDQRWFLMGTSATSTTATGAQYGRLVDARTNGSHSVSTDTIYYLGRDSS